MKRVFTALAIIVLSIALLLVCMFAEDKEHNAAGKETGSSVVKKESEGTTSVTETEEDTIFFLTGVYADTFFVDWKNAYATYENAAVPNKEVAIEIATAIFNGMEKNAEVQQYIPQSVFYDEQDEVWVVCLSKPDDGAGFMLGSSLNIAIQKSDGKVLRIWYR